VKPDTGAGRLLAGLAGLNVLGYVDRQLVVALAPLLIADLGLSRADIGILVGVSFIPVFAIGTLVVGALADRLSRPGLIAKGLAVWSVATGLTGTAAGFSSLIAWRTLVGVGEATLPPTALSMLGDRFPAPRLGLANGVFYAGIPVGFAISFALAGWIGPWLGWRACFLVLGIVGLGAVAAAARMSDPRRGGGKTAGAGPRQGASGPMATLRGIARALAARPALGLVVLGATLLAFTSSSSQHSITWLVEERGFPYARAAFLSGAFVFVAGLTGNLSIGWLTDRARARLPAGRLFAFVAFGVVGLGSAAAFYLLPPSSPFFFPAWFLAQGWMLGWFGPALAAIDEEAPFGWRATVIGFGLLAVNLLGVATGPWVTGAIGDRRGLTTGLLVSVGVGVLGLVVLAMAALLQARSPRRD
jgi:MFS family permease